MSYKRVDTLGQASFHGLWLKVTCAGCGRWREVPPSALIPAFGAAAYWTDIGDRLRCHGEDLKGGGCGHRGAIVTLLMQPPPTEPDPVPGGNVIPLPTGARPQSTAAPMLRTRRAARKAASAEPPSVGDLPAGALRYIPAGVDPVAWWFADDRERKRLIRIARG